MSILRAIACILLPPLAVIDKGCGSILLVFILWLFGWIPGVIGAIIICNKD
ncbi:MAG: YqaE/Pmp3 family membrane protein [Candidatus Brocadiia bacterium]